MGIYVSGLRPRSFPQWWAVLRTCILMCLSLLALLSSVCLGQVPTGQHMPFQNQLFLLFSTCWFHIRNLLSHQLFQSFQRLWNFGDWVDSFSGFVYIIFQLVKFASFYQRSFYSLSLFWCFICVYQVLSRKQPDASPHTSFSAAFSHVTQLARGSHGFWTENPSLKIVLIVHTYRFFLSLFPEEYSICLQSLHCIRYFSSWRYLEHMEYYMFYVAAVPFY